jgi:hypothetical protein
MHISRMSKEGQDYLQSLNGIGSIFHLETLDFTVERRTEEAIISVLADGRRGWWWSNSSRSKKDMPFLILFVFLATGDLSM